MTRFTSDLERPLRIGTRGSALALAQVQLVIDRLHDAFPERRVELRVIRTEGDIDRTSPLAEIGGRGVFTNAIEAAIVDGTIDAAVHSAKDLPSSLHPMVPIVAFPDRDDPRDVLVSRHGTTLDRLPLNPIIGTSSRRRDVQIRRLRPDVRVRSIRGNVDTRLRKAAENEFDAIVLAAAGIRRMGWENQITEILPVEMMVPAPGQGALAIQAQEGSVVAELLRTLDDPVVSTPVEIERAFLAASGVGCSYPVGAYVAADRSGYRLVAMLANSAGDRFGVANETLAAGAERQHAAELAARMAADVGLGRSRRLWNGARALRGDLMGLRVVVTRPRRQAEPLVAAFQERGATPLLLPTIRIEPLAGFSELDVTLEQAKGGRFDWLVFTSANAVSITAERMAALGFNPGQLTLLRVATVGPATDTAAREAGFNVGVTAVPATSEGLVNALGDHLRPGQRVIYPRSAIGRHAVPDGLRRAGAEVVAVDVYRTVPASELDVDPEVLDQIRRGDYDAIVFASPSAVRGFVDLIDVSRNGSVAIPVFCTGPVTADAAVQAGFRVAAVSENPDAFSVVETIASHWRERRPEVFSGAAQDGEFVAGRSAE
jgi:hydroxymethylbilane synthase